MSKSNHCHVRSVQRSRVQRLLALCRSLSGRHSLHTTAMLGDLMYLENIREYVEDHRIIVSNVLSAYLWLLYFSFAGNLQMVE